MERAWVAALAAGADVLIAIAYATAGVLLLRRMRASPERRAGALFAIWWFGIAATGLVSLALYWLANAGAHPVALDLTQQASLATYALAVGGFASYVLFIYLGSHRLTWAVFLALALLVAWSLLAALLEPATSFTLEGWRREATRPGTLGPPAELTATLLATLSLAAVAGYAMLYRKVPDGPARRRVALVSTALLLWLAGSGVASVPALQMDVAVQLATRVVILASAVMILAAYRPPGTASAPRATHERRRLLEARVRELV